MRDDEVSLAASIEPPEFPELVVVEFSGCIGFVGKNKRGNNLVALAPIECGYEDGEIIHRDQMPITDGVRYAEVLPGYADAYKALMTEKRKKQDREKAKRVVFQLGQPVRFVRPRKIHTLARVSALHPDGSTAELTLHDGEKVERPIGCNRFEYWTAARPCEMQGWAALWRGESRYRAQSEKALIFGLMHAERDVRGWAKADTGNVFIKGFASNRVFNPDAPEDAADLAEAEREGLKEARADIPEQVIAQEAAIWLLDDLTDNADPFIGWFEKEWAAGRCGTWEDAARFEQAAAQMRQGRPAAFVATPAPSNHQAAASAPETAHQAPLQAAPLAIGQKKAPPPPPERVIVPGSVEAWHKGLVDVREPIQGGDSIVVWRAKMMRAWPTAPFMKNCKTVDDLNEACAFVFGDNWQERFEEEAQEFARLERERLAAEY